MSTIIVRKIRSAPHRPAAETWGVISELLLQGSSNCAAELDSAAGIIASTIVDLVPEKSAIVVIGNGPRVRFYCLYGDDAISGDDANEDALPVKPLEGDWKICVPFVPDEVEWARSALKKVSSRILAYDSKVGLDGSEKAAATPEAVIDFDALNRL